jgi:4-hydroxy-2-oxoheptanedioate aldolase
MEAIVQNAVYPPLGQRSFGPTMAAFADLDPGATNMKYFEEMSKKVAVIPMIESVEGLENAEAICSVEGVTAVFIGPVDLRLSMGLAGGDGSEEVFLKALQNVLQIGKKLGIPIGTFAADGEACQKRTADGFDFIMVSSPFQLCA